jgi:hypothetical protein
MNKTKKNETTVKNATKKPAPLVAGPGEIVIRNGNGPQVIKAERLHDFFAMHPPLNGKGHALTHVPTGYTIGTYRTRLLATWVAAQLRAFGGAELWAFTDPNHMATHADKTLLARLRRLADATTAEQDMKDGALTPPAKAKRKTVADLAASKPITPAVHGDHGTPKYSAPWRSGVDWVAAGKKAYETRLRNLAAQQAPPAPQPPAPKAPRAPKAPAPTAPPALSPKAPKAPAPTAPPALRPKAPAPMRARA